MEKLPELARRFVADSPVCLGELVFCAQNEMVGKLPDLLRRRLPLALITRLTEERLRLAAAIAGKVLEWPEQRQVQEVRAMLETTAGS